MKNVTEDTIKLAISKGYYKPMTFDNRPYEDIIYAEHCLIQKWLEETHNILIEIKIDRTSEPKYLYEIYMYENFGNWTRLDKHSEFFIYYTQYEALEEAIKESLNHI